MDFNYTSVLKTRRIPVRLQPPDGQLIYYVICMGLSLTTKWQQRVGVLYQCTSVHVFIYLCYRYINIIYTYTGQDARALQVYSSGAVGFCSKTSLPPGTAANVYIFMPCTEDKRTKEMEWKKYRSNNNNRFPVAAGLWTYPVPLLLLNVNVNIYRASCYQEDDVICRPRVPFFPHPPVYITAILYNNIHHAALINVEYIVHI